MSAQELESQRENPPQEWVQLRETEEDSFSEGDFAKAFCSFVSEFYWREREDKPDELHVVFRNDDEPDERYRHFDVPKKVYDEMWERAYFPEDYYTEWGSWFGKNISGEYESEKFEQ